MSEKIYEFSDSPGLENIETREKAARLLSQFVELNVPEPPFRKVDMTPPKDEHPTSMDKENVWTANSGGWKLYFEKYRVAFMWRVLYEYQLLTPRRCRIGRYRLYWKVRTHITAMTNHPAPAMCFVMLLIKHVITDQQATHTELPSTDTHDIPDLIQPSEQATWRNSRSLRLLHRLAGHSEDRKGNIYPLVLRFLSGDQNPNILHLRLNDRSTTPASAVSGDSITQEQNPNIFSHLRSNNHSAPPSPAASTSSNSSSGSVELTETSSPVTTVTEGLTP